MARLAVAASLRPERRFATLALAPALLMWAGGSVRLSLAGITATVSFPSPGEWLFVSSTVLMAVHLSLDAAGRPRPTLADWLEAAVACGGAVCLAALLVVTPVAAAIGHQGVPLLVALVYPVLDVVLVLVVVAQTVLRTRALSAGTAATVAGLALLAVADTSGAVVTLSAGTYAYGLLQDFMWCAAYVLLTDGACRPRREPPAPGEPSSTGARLTVAAAAVALGVLVLQPTGAARLYVVVRAWRPSWPPVRCSCSRCARRAAPPRRAGSRARTSSPACPTAGP